jgi:hypothetical protein
MQAHGLIEGPARRFLLALTLQVLAQPEVRMGLRNLR